ncbi:MAG TPA: glycosyltransferase family 39 protein [Candidatus Bathyarchaeia archaeon]|nr:glycosyltransferase family 39 protein [Candidatus Bathyarchaeia archaeon]
MFGRISILVRNRNVFLVSLALISVLKIGFSVVAPASFDLQSMVELATLGRLIGPWIALYPPLYFAPNSTLLQSWTLSAPPSMGIGLRFLSLLMRLPIFMFDFGTLVVLYYIGKRLKSPVAGRIAALLWFVNPYLLFSIELIGVPDIAATFFVVAAILMILYDRPRFCGIFLGLGIWIKLYPALLLPPLLMFAHQHGVLRREKATILVFGIVGLIGYMLWTLPYGTLYLTSYYSPVTLLLPFIGGEYSVNGAAFGLIIFYCIVALFAKKTTSPAATMLQTLLVFYALSNWSFYVQYLTWALPLMALDIAVYNSRRAILLTSICVFSFAQWFFLSAGLATPSGYSLLLVNLASNSAFSIAINHLLNNQFVQVFAAPIISSAGFASMLIYVIDAASSWFTNNGKSMNIE